MIVVLKKIVKPRHKENCKTIVFYGYYDKKYFKNNIKIIILLKRTWIKNNFETIVINCGFKENYKTTVCDCSSKDISETFKITVINSGFLH